MSDIRKALEDLVALESDEPEMPRGKWDAAWAAARAALAHPAEPDAYPALQALTEAVLTRADADYMRRQLDEAVRIMATRGWSPPVPYQQKAQPAESAALTDDEMADCGMLSEMRIEEERRAEWHAEMRRDAFGEKP